MVQCLNCEKHFRDNYRLNRHMSRLVPCKNKNGEKINSQNPKIQSLDPKIQSLDPKIQSLDPKIQSLDPKIQSLGKCGFCLNTYSTIWYKNKHQETCKHREDPVRLLEIKNGVKPRESVLKNECRFCNNEFHNISNLKKHLSIPFWIRNAVCVTITQLLDTILFSFLGLFSLVACLTDIILVSYFVKIVIIALLAPLTTCVKWLIPQTPRDSYDISL